jgi:hypothetical protein
LRSKEGKVRFNDPMLVTVVQRARKQNLDLDPRSPGCVRRAAASGVGAELLLTADLRGLGDL